MAGKPNPAQESLIIAGEQPDQLIARTFTDAGESVESTAVNHVIEQKLHLINCLSRLAAASKLAGLVTAGPEAVKDSYGTNAPKVVEGAKKKHPELLRQARWSFARGVGHFALIDSGLMPKQAAEAQTGAMYAKFESLYSAAENNKRLSDYRRLLQKQVAFLAGDLEVTASAFNRKYGLRPHKPASRGPSETITGENADELPGLDTRERMTAILFDPRASFMPKTHREKNLVLSWLDYLDNPEYPLGVMHQLYEVLRHSQRPDREKIIRRGARFGLRANESICWEVGDYMLDAARQLKAIQALRYDIADFSPKVLLSEEFQSPLDHHGLRAWVRHRDLKIFIERGEVPGLDGSDPLATSEQRLKPKTFGDTDTGKHKNILNQYTRADIKEPFQQHMEELLSTATIADARADLSEVAEDLGAEYGFMRKRLAEMQVRGSQRVKKAVQQIFTELQSLDAVA